jgi:hypothetical protein
MTKDFLINRLETTVDARRESRLRVASNILENKLLFPFLLDIVFNVNNKISIKAAWVLEFVCQEKLVWLSDYLDYFTTNLNRVKYGSAVRPLSKICQFLAHAYNSKTPSSIKENLSKKHKDLIIETCFDWLISTHKVAVKVFAMESLYLFGSDYEWVHRELALIIQQNIICESAAYKARGGKLLKLLKQK